ncbi:MAG: hypothetical protein EAZ30_01565 [Betaproteobacteria bacterium]|nr:MAG: hypothetical protein EAZ30_01565 [Betaproteobacteria bacterium]
MKCLSNLALTACLFIAVGCQTTAIGVAEQSARQMAATQTVASFRDLKPVPIVLSNGNEPMQLSVNMLTDATLQKVQQPEGEPILATLYSLPEPKTAYSVRISAAVSGSRDHPTVYYPRMLFLDEAFIVTRYTTQNDFRFRANGANGAISATVFVNEGNRNERYLVVLEEPAKGVTEQLSLIAGQAPPPMVLPLPLKLAEMMWVVGSTSNEPERRLRAARAGVYELSFAPYRTKRLGE